jgi:SAM-dependent methyltransferase
MNNSAKIPNWTFDKDIALRFQQEAQQHIPDYRRVIDLCLDIANATVKKTDSIIDVGSALGYTLEKFISAGFVNTIGVEKSLDMIDQSWNPAKVICSDTFPKQQFQLVLLNWTLHFVKNKSSYLDDIYQNLNNGGALILTDKTTQSPEIKKLYYRFKLDNGVTQDYIELKEQQLIGVMHTVPVEWYIEQLKNIGFRSIEIINANLGFVSIYCVK